MSSISYEIADTGQCCSEKQWVNQTNDLSIYFYISVSSDMNLWNSESYYKRTELSSLVIVDL